MKDYEKVLKEIFNIDYLMPYQEMVVLRILENAGRKENTCSLTILPTGSGKSLIFMLPSVMLDGYTILTYPLLSLMNDQRRRFEEAGIPVELISGQVTGEERTKALGNLREGKSNILISNPETLAGLLNKGCLDFLSGRLELFVVDEVHTLPTWGHSFRSSLLMLPGMIERMNPHQRLFFSATLDSSALKELRNMFGEDMEMLRLSSDRENIYYRVVRSLNKKKDIRSILEKEDRRPALVFCSYRRECEDLQEYFSRYFETLSYHAGLPDDVKKRTEKIFQDSSRAVLFATNAYGMGVDKKNIRCVIHLRPSEDALSFLQESGRGGRDGRPCESFTLVYPEDKGGLKKLFLSPTCIRRSLLELMGEDRTEDYCLLCDYCQSSYMESVNERHILRLVEVAPLFFSRRSLTLLLRLDPAFSGWKKREIEKAVANLIEFGKIGTFLSRLRPGPSAS